MDNESELYKMLGELSANVKNILVQLQRNDSDMRRLQDEHKKEVRDIHARLDKVEKFNIRMLAYASIAVPVLMVITQWGVPLLLTLLL